MERGNVSPGDRLGRSPVADRRAGVGGVAVDGAGKGDPRLRGRVASTPLDLGQAPPPPALDFFALEGWFRGRFGDQLQAGGDIVGPDRRADGRVLPAAGSRDGGSEVLRGGGELERVAPPGAGAAKSGRERSQAGALGSVEFAAAGHEQHDGDQAAVLNVEGPKPRPGLEFFGLEVREGAALAGAGDRRPAAVQCGLSLRGHDFGTTMMAARRSAARARRARSRTCSRSTRSRRAGSEKILDGSSK